MCDCNTVHSLSGALGAVFAPLKDIVVDAVFRARGSHEMKHHLLEILCQGERKGVVWCRWEVAFVRADSSSSAGMHKCAYA